MKVINKTKYRTDDLRRIFMAGLRDRGVDHRKYHITVVPGRFQHSGYAYYHSGTITMRLPPDASVNAVAQVFEHEVLHTQGMTHRKMHPDVRYCRQKVAWLDAAVGDGASVFPLRLREVKATPVALIIEKRETHARAMLKKAEIRLKRAQTIAKKWKRSVAYYDRKLHARIGAEIDQRMAAGKKTP